MKRGIVRLVSSFRLAVFSHLCTVLFLKLIEGFVPSLQFDIIDVINVANYPCKRKS
jgi:hypothetical protein